MSIDAISALSSDQARVDAASLRLATALSMEQADPTTDPNEVAQGRAAAASARADLAQAEAAVSADEAAAAAPAAQPQDLNAAANATDNLAATPAPSDHILEVVV